MFFYIAQKQCACKKTRFLLLKLIKLQAGDNMRRDLAWSHCIPMIVLYTVIALIIMSDLDLFALLRAKQHKTMFCSCWSGLHCKQLTAMWQSSTLCPSTVDSFVDSNEREYFLTLQAMHCRKTCSCCYQCDTNVNMPFIIGTILFPLKSFHWIIMVRT